VCKKRSVYLLRVHRLLQRAYSISAGVHKSSYHKWSLTRFVIEELMILKQGSLSNKRCC